MMAVFMWALVAFAWDMMANARTLEDLEKAPEVAYQDILNEIDMTWGSKTL
jgi:hypothetical protein